MEYKLYRNGVIAGNFDVSIDAKPLYLPYDNDDCNSLQGYSANPFKVLCKSFHQIILRFSRSSKNLGKDLESLRKQAAALSTRKPVVDILLPRELILSQTIVFENDFSIETRGWDLICKLFSITYRYFLIVQMMIKFKQPFFVIVFFGLFSCNNSNSLDLKKQDFEDLSNK